MTAPRTSLTDPGLNWTDPTAPNFIPHRAVASPDGGYAVELTQDETADIATAAAAWTAAAPARALDSLAAKRYAVMTGGIAIAALHFSVRTDDDSRAMISAVQQAVATGSAPAQIPWKAVDGFHVIAPADVTTIFNAVAAHVAECFGNEAALAATIAASQTPEAVDISGGWPPNG